jgi:hypothetical protein
MPRYIEVYISQYGCDDEVEIRKIGSAWCMYVRCSCKLQKALHVSWDGCRETRGKCGEVPMGMLIT